MKFLIEQEDAQRIADYLVGRPYREVAHLVEPLMKLERADQPEVKPAPEGDGVAGP